MRPKLGDVVLVSGWAARCNVKARVVQDGDHSVMVTNGGTRRWTPIADVVQILPPDEKCRVEIGSEESGYWECQRPAAHPHDGVITRGGHAR